MSYPEAYHLLVVEALRLGLMPTISQMRCGSTRHYHTSAHPPSLFSFVVSIVGIIAVPGMMARAILDGSDVKQAARLQMIVMFMIAASTTFSCIVAIHLVLWMCVDSKHRIRSDHIDTRPHALLRAGSGAVNAIVSMVARAWIFAILKFEHLLPEEGRAGTGSYANSPSERTRLLA